MLDHNLCSCDLGASRAAESPFWAAERPSGLQQSLHQVLFCAEGSSGTGEAACGKLLAAALSEEPVVPKVQGPHAASMPQVQPGSCLVDAEMRSLGGSLLVSGQPAGE